MITVTFEDLPKAAEDALRRWLNMDPAKTVRRVVDSQVKALQAKALQEALTANPFNLKIEAANATILKAQRYQNFLDVLQEIEQQAEPFKIARLV